MATLDLAGACRWAEPGGRDAAAAILRFLDEIGIPVGAGSTVGQGLLTGLAFRDGTILVDIAVDVFPGDLLHEAGHFAVTDLATRGALTDPGDDPAEEMAAIAWSVAAAQACGVSLDILFHDHGYKGGSPGLAAAFASGSGPGVPVLAWYGMTAEPHRATSELPAFPVMQRWLR